MTLFDAVILGLVEGITEFLPISSTGHLILASHLLGISQTEFFKTFLIAIQLGAIFSVIAGYWKSFLNIELLKRIAAAFIPTGIIGFALYGVIRTVLLESEAVVLWALFLGGIALIIFEILHTEKEDAPEDVASIPYRTAFLIGVFQSLAVIPGVSRAAATIIGGLLLGLKRVAIVEFSFLLAVPTMLVATGYDVYKNANAFTFDNFLILLVGFITSFIVALFAMRFLLAFVKNHSFIPFGIYRIAIAALFFLLVL